MSKYPFQVWMKLYIGVALLLCLIYSENIIQDAALIKARFIDSGQKFLGVQDLFAVWEEGEPIHLLNRHKIFLFR